MRSAPPLLSLRSRRTRRPGVRILHSGFLALLLLGLPVWMLSLPKIPVSEGGPPPDDTQLREVVRSQVEALQRGDLRTAAEHAHPDYLSRAGINPSTFNLKDPALSSEYHPVRSARRVAFGRVHRLADSALVEVFLDSNHGVVTPAVYTLAPDRDGFWKVKEIQFQRSYRSRDFGERLEI